MAIAGPLERNPATGKIERTIEQTYDVKVYERPPECYSCIQTPGSSICKSSCPAWPAIKERKDTGQLPFILEPRTRFVFPSKEV
jgi:hypothetical protein